jgi:quercetin dioxygenase-like cupin family protein
MVVSNSKANGSTAKSNRKTKETKRTKRKRVKASEGKRTKRKQENQAKTREPSENKRTKRKQENQENQEKRGQAMMKHGAIRRPRSNPVLRAVTMVIVASGLFGSLPANAKTDGSAGGATTTMESTITATTTGKSTAVAHIHQRQSANDIQFGPAPSVFPAGAEMAVLQGDPSTPGAVFTVRLRFPNGYVLPAHWHPTDENVTVISGTFLVGIGDKFNRAALLPAFHPGDFTTAPANVNHFATVKGRTVVQVHAVGPFQLTYVESTATK